MFVRKFEADSIEEALKEIKRELGPDAVILKTITNKGLKGAFKKNKIEITAAISEKNYVRKAHVDTVLDSGQKEEFYNGSAGYISNMIDQHDNSREKRGGAGYGSAGLNRVVNSTKGISSQVKAGVSSGLDDFLSLGEREVKEKMKKVANSSFNFEEKFEEKFEERKPVQKVQRATFKPVLIDDQEKSIPESSHYQTKNNEVLENQKNKIDDLEKRIFELTKSFERIHKKEAVGIYQLRTTLRSLGINEIYIQQLIKKGLFELTESEVENADSAFEFALREMMLMVNTASSAFKDDSSNREPVITVFISEVSCGQSSLIQKISAMKDESVIIKKASSLKNNFAEKFLKINTINASTISEIVSECRKSIESGKCVFIDYKCNSLEENETKKFIDGLRRAFKKVEVLITLSAIHSELYNRKVLGMYRRLSDGIVVSHLDSCLDFGSLFNITQDIKDLPYKFFGTGEVIPDDIEIATAERVLAGIFKFL